MKMQEGKKAADFTAITIDGESFHLSGKKGKKILLSFLRNGACPYSNLRVKELMAEYQNLSAAGIEIIVVFESAQADMLFFEGKQTTSFTILSDPGGVLYNLYGLESSPQKINYVFENQIHKKRLQRATSSGFLYVRQEAANLFRMPADFLIDENFILRQFHYSNFLIDHIDIEDIFSFAGLKAGSFVT
jgi:thioredoxin-dependent peroxiredoxin